MQQNYKFTIAYDGTRFFGWERQPDRETIQGKLESVLSRLQGAPVEIIGAGRTDAGVHARAMVANAELDVKESPEEIRDYMNRYLPDAIAVREVKPCAPRFHARYKAIGKTYRYTVHVGEVKPVFDRKYVTILPYVPEYAVPVWHLFAIRCQNRDALADYLASKGIGTNKHYPIAMHLQDCYADLGIEEGALPIAEEISATELSLPIYYGMSEEEIDYVIDAVNQFEVNP